MKGTCYGNPGNINMKGKKTYALMRGKFVEDVVVNHKDKELEKIHGLEVTEIWVDEFTKCSKCKIPFGNITGYVCPDVFCPTFLKASF